MKRLVLSALTLALATGVVLCPQLGAATEADITFVDQQAQTKEFMGYYESIKLTDEQERVKKEALTVLPAPCCSDNSAYTCCCPCNLSRSIWGLSAFLITERDFGPEQVREKVTEWIDFLNPEGFSGNVCYSSGGCPRPFAANGCGGMNPAQVNWPDAATGGN